MPMSLLRPPQPSPDMHVPVVRVPQHVWPMALQVSHWCPVAETVHDNFDMHGAIPASSPPDEQHAWFSAPHVPHVPAIPALWLRLMHPSPCIQEPPLLIPQQI